MTTEDTLLAVYRALLSLYPRPFRDEYGADMEQLVRDQLRDERTSRVVARTAADLVTTVPRRHMERHMRLTRNLLTTTFVLLALGGLGVALLAGTEPPGIALGLAIALVAIAGSVLAWRWTGPAPTPTAVPWWAPVAAGVVLVGIVVVAANAGVEAWFLGMASLLTGGALVVVGLALGASQIVRRIHPGAPTA